MVMAAVAVGTAVVAGGTSYLAAGAQEDAAREAQANQRRATGSAVEEQRQQYEQTRTDLEPWRKTGETAMGEYGALYGVGEEGLLSPEETQAARDRFQTSPGYEFAMEEGTRALDRSAASRGRLRGGGYGRELTRYGQGMANQEFGNYANRLANIAGMGQEAATATGQFGAQKAANVANTMMGGAAIEGKQIQEAGKQRASGYVGMNKAFQGGVQNLMIGR